jgi:hypothetical protein
MCRSRSRSATASKSRCAPHEDQAAAARRGLRRAGVAPSDVESEKSGQCKADHEHRPVRQIQPEKSTLVGDTRLHDTLYSVDARMADAVARMKSLGERDRKALRSGDAASGGLRQRRSRHCAHGRFATVGQLRIRLWGWAALQIKRAGVGSGLDRRQPIALEDAVDVVRSTLRRRRNGRYLQAGDQGENRKSQADAEKICTVWTHETAPVMRRRDQAKGSTREPLSRPRGAQWRRKASGGHVVKALESPRNLSRTSIGVRHPAAAMQES